MIDLVTCLCFVHRLEDLEPNSSRSLIAYLGGGAIPGVGPVTARRMLGGLGDGVLEILDSPGQHSTLKCLTNHPVSGRVHIVREGGAKGPPA